MYRCLECGEEFDTPKTERECMGEYWGFPAHAEYTVSPCCGGDYGELTKYEVDICVTETYTIEVNATSYKDAEKLALEEHNKGNAEYIQTDIETNVK